jgi:hypothetical protein
LLVSDWVSQSVSQSVSQWTADIQSLWAVAGSWGQGYFGNPEEGERPPLEAATKQWLVKTWLDTSVCVCVFVYVFL